MSVSGEDLIIEGARTAEALYQEKSPNQATPE